MTNTNVELKKIFNKKIMRQQRNQHFHHLGSDYGGIGGDSP